MRDPLSLVLCHVNSCYVSVYYVFVLVPASVSFFDCVMYYVSLLYGVLFLCVSCAWFFVSVVCV